MTTRQDIFNYVNQEFGTEPEYPWAKYPKYAVLRNRGSGKWYCIVMNISKEKAGLSESGFVDVIDVKCDPLLVGSLLQTSGFFPAYHMNKSNWIGIRLDGSVPEKDIFHFIDLGYRLVTPKPKAKKKQ